MCQEHLLPPKPTGLVCCFPAKRANPHALTDLLQTLLPLLKLCVSPFSFLEEKLAVPTFFQSSLPADSLLVVALPIPRHSSPSSLPFGQCSQCHQKHRGNFHIGFLELYIDYSMSVPSSTHTSPTSPFLLPLSFICLDSFQELCNPSFAISFNNLGKVGFCHTFRLACFTKIAKIPV